MAGQVCLDPRTLEQLAQIEEFYSGVFTWAPAGVGPPNGSQPFYFDTSMALLRGAADSINGVPGTFPLTPGQLYLTLAAAIQDFMIGQEFAYGYTVQSINTVGVLLGARMNLLYNDSIAHADAVGATLGAELGGTAANLQGNINSVYGTLSNELAGTAANLQGNINSVYGTLSNELAGTAANLQGNINAVEGKLSSELAGTAANLQGNINAVEGEIHNAVGNAVATAESFATDASAAAGAAAVAQAVAQLQPQISKIATDTAECLDPLCDTVTPNAKELGNLGKLLHGFTEAALTGALLAFLVECVADPQAAADEVQAVAGPIVGATASGLEQLLGV